jgi:hypothetical protein
MHEYQKYEEALMCRNLKFSDRKSLQRAFVYGRNRGQAAERRRSREKNEQKELDDDCEREEKHDG